MSESIWNVRQFGALGDGERDDTAAIQAAIDAAEPHRGTVYFPPGNYRCADLLLKPFVGLNGDSTWSFRQNGGTVLSLSRPDAVCLCNITHAVGTSISGLCFQGDRDSKTVVHGLYKKGENCLHTEDSITIERCRINGFSGDGVHFAGVWCYSIRSCMLSHNARHGLYVNGCDGFILDNWMSGNTGAGIGSDYWLCSTTITANRVEWNHKAGIALKGGATLNVTGNYFDRSGGPGFLFQGTGPACDTISLTGNVFYRNGSAVDLPDENHNCHMYLHTMRGITCTGNTGRVAKDDGGKDGKLSPSYGMVLGNLDCSIVHNNVFFKGATREVVRNLGGHDAQTEIQHNPGSLYYEE